MDEDNIFCKKESETNISYPSRVSYMSWLSENGSRRMYSTRHDTAPGTKTCEDILRLSLYSNPGGGGMRGAT